MSGAEPEKPKNKEWVRPFWFLFNVGWYVALSIAVPTGIGYWLDLPERLNSHPLYSLIGFGVGTVTAFYGLYRMLRRFRAEQLLFYAEQKDASKKDDTEIKEQDNA